VALPAGTVASAGLAVGQQLQISGVNGTRTISAINGDTLTLTDGPIVTASLTGTVSLVRIGGDTITLTGPSYAGTLTASFSAGVGTITRGTTPTSDWIKDGFAVGPADHPRRRPDGPLHPHRRHCDRITFAASSFRSAHS